MTLPIVYLTRIEQFSSAHRLHNDQLDAATNLNLFGKCNNTHGHNYKLELTVKGPISPESGMVMDIGKLKNIIQDVVFRQMDHKNIDQDVDFFKQTGTVSTSENIAVFIWNEIEARLDSKVKLYRVKLYETEKNVVEYYGSCRELDSATRP